MRKALIALHVSALIAITPGSALAWGFAGHRLIMQRAIELMPPELKPFFTHFKDEVVIRVVDPDLWARLYYAAGLQQP